MEKYCLQKRSVLSFKTGRYEDGDISYMYVIHTCKSSDESLLALTLSNGMVRIVKSADLSNVGAVNIGRTTLFCSLFLPSDPKVLVLSERNGHITVFDYASQTMKVEYNTVREIFSCAILCGGKMLLCADKQNIYFYELETGKRIGMYRDLHSDVVNNLIAHPTYPTVFASGSEDGLICVFDVARGNQDDALLSIFQTESGVSSMNWFGGNNELIWCASMTRGISVWNSINGDRLTDINDFYPILSKQGIEIDYVVGCVPFQNSLYALCGMQDGTGFVVSVEHPDQIVVQWKGHESAIRSVLCAGSSVVTSGEDASVCLWSANAVEKGVKSGGVERMTHAVNRKDKYRLV